MKTKRQVIAISKSKTTLKTLKSDEPKLTARQFMDGLFSLRTKAEIDRVDKFFRDEDTDNKCLGVRMSSIFILAKQFSSMPLGETEKLLDSEYYEARMGAVSIMNFQARNRKISASTRKELYDLYINRRSKMKPHFHDLKFHSR